MTTSQQVRTVLREAICRFIDDHAEDIVACNLWLYEHPELSGEEFESAKMLAATAVRFGLSDDVQEGMGSLPTAYRCTRESGAAGSHIAFLSEYDALPGVGHGCGHNMIGTVGVFAAAALAHVLPQVGRGKVSAFGTPAEETDGGKITMLNEGAFEGVDAALMMHPGSVTEFDYTTLSCRGTTVEFFGKSSHAAASPWNGVNALNAMIQLFVSKDLILRHLPLTARCPGVITHGGERANVIPEYTKASFSVRGATRDEAALVYDKLVNCANGAALAAGCRVEFGGEGNPYWDMRPDKKLAKWYEDVWAEQGGEPPIDYVIPHGSIDIGNLSYFFPCLHVHIRIQDDASIGGHSREFADCTLTEFGREQMLRTIKCLAMTGLEKLLDE